MRITPTNTTPTLPNRSSRPVVAVASSGIPIVEASAAYQEPLVLSVYGSPGSGKSRLIGSAPGDIGALPMEHKSRQSIIKSAQEFGKRVLFPDVDLVRSGRALMVENIPATCITADSYKQYNAELAEKHAEYAMGEKLKNLPLDGRCPECCQRCYYRWHVNRVKSVAYRMAEMDNIKTIAIDPFGQFVDDMLFACYGRNEKIMPLDRRTFNREVIDFINAINHKNLILSHHVDTVWKDNKPTNKTKPRNSFSRIGHFTSVVCELRRDDDALKYNHLKQPDDDPKPVYWMRVMDCQANAGLIGLDLLTDDGVSFKNLAMAVYEDSDEAAWE